MGWIEILAYGLAAGGYTVVPCAVSIADHIKRNLRISPEEVLRRHEEGNYRGE